jgi:hypothetical protein
MRMRGDIEAELTGATTAKGSNGLEDKDGNNESAQRGGKGEDRDSRQATGDRRRQSDCLSTYLQDGGRSCVQSLILRN